MKVLLIDVDSKIPNLALMQISAWHKAQGDEVGFHTKDPDKIYVSCVFKKNAWKVNGYKLFNPEAEVLIGGSGVSWDWLPEPMRKIKPDYDLYPDMEYSMGFTTRGCIRRCPFCIVKDKEGKYHRWQHIKEFHDHRFNTVQLLDNTWYADKEWFMENTQYLIDNKIKVIENGMDIRILDQEIASRLKELRWASDLHFAWDNLKDEEAVKRGIELLKNVKISLRSKVQFYILAGYNTTFEQDLYRCNKLKEWGTNPYVMRYKKTTKLNQLARWANAKPAFWSCDFKDYDPSKFR